LSLPTTLGASPLITRDEEAFACAVVLGGPAIDAPVAGPRGAWLLSHLEGGFTLLVFDAPVSKDAADALANDTNPCAVLQVGHRPIAGGSALDDSERLMAARYDGKPGTCYLFRPDQHVCARWRSFDLPSVRRAIARAAGAGDMEKRDAA
jgi:3-(3-hydroxy-phenyl)propionate hydroxylase